jgi:transcriptional regulator with XRE-family HTH domain
MNKINKDRLIKLRENEGISQEELGRRTGLSRGMISNYERGFRNPELKNLIILADYFDVSTDYLLGKTDDPSPIKKEQINNDQELDLKQIKKALLEKELVYDGHKLTKKQQDSIRAILLAAIEREEPEENN